MLMYLAGHKTEKKLMRNWRAESVKGNDMLPRFPGPSHKCHFPSSQPVACLTNSRVCMLVALTTMLVLAIGS